MTIKPSFSPEPPIDLKTVHGAPEPLTVEDGTLCDFCNLMNTQVPENGQPYRLRLLPELLSAAKACGYCAMWVRSLKASAQAVSEGGHELAIQSHPLLQSWVEPAEVELQYLEIHDYFQGFTEQRIVWPPSLGGTTWATLDLVPVRGKLPRLSSRQLEPG